MLQDIKTLDSWQCSFGNRFSCDPNKNLTVVVWGEFENVFQIDDKGGILYNVRR